MSELLIEAKKLSKSYILPGEKIAAVKDLDLKIFHGDFISIMGPSGSGKTTLLDSLGCLTTISSGQLFVGGQDVSCMKENKLVGIRRKYFSFIFQDFLLIPTLTAMENVLTAQYFARQKQDKVYAKEVLKSVGLEARVNHLPAQLSGGEKQRVALARSLAVNPKVLFADEPTGNLDSKVSQEVFDLFKKLNKEQGLTIVVVTHNPELGKQASRVIYMKDGNVVL